MDYYFPTYDAYYRGYGLSIGSNGTRCAGSGDYKFKEDFEWYGAWSDCRLSAEPTPSEDYERIAPTFPAITSIASDDPMLESAPIAPRLETQKAIEDRLRAALKKQFCIAA